MTDPDIFLRGILIGVIVAAPVGPVALLCIRETRDDGVVQGVATGLGAALADVFYAMVAVFGVFILSSLLLDHQRSLRLAGGSLMLALAAAEWFAKPRDPSTIKEPRNPLGSFGLGFAMAFTNPLTIIGFTAVFIAFGFAEVVLNPVGKVSLVAGVAVGSAAWWLFLVALVRRGLRLLTPRAQVLMNHATAAMLAVFGVYAIVTGISGETPMTDFLHFGGE